MKNKYTILIIPPDNRPPRQIRMSIGGKRFLGAGALVIAGLMGGLLFYNIHQANYIKGREAAYAHMEQLQGTLIAQQDQITGLLEKNQQMTDNLQAIGVFQTKIASLLNLPELAPSQTDSTEPAGLSRGGDIEQEFNPMSAAKNADQVNTSLLAMQTIYDQSVKYKDKLDHTPTILPLTGNHEIASPFGYRKNPFGGKSSEFHDGVDFACNYGSEVMATADGKVTFAGWDSVYGRRVTIDHGYGVVTFYGHNSKLLVSVGEEVKKGQLIAYSGNSGRSTGSHLHYGAIVDGKSVDPLIFTNPTKEQ